MYRIFFKILRVSNVYFSNHLYRISSARSYIYIYNYVEESYFHRCNNTHGVGMVIFYNKDVDLLIMQTCIQSDPGEPTRWKTPFMVLNGNSGSKLRLLSLTTSSLVMLGNSLIVTKSMKKDENWYQLNWYSRRKIKRTVQFVLKPMT